MKYIVFISCIFIFTYQSIAKEVRIISPNHVTTLELEVAITDEQRKTGLMYRESLAKNTGMLFMYDPPRLIHMWMKNTYIPLDILFIDETRHITHIARNAMPHDLTPISSKKAVSMAIEINAGSAKKHGISIGDQVIVEQDD